MQNFTSSNKEQHIGSNMNNFNEKGLSIYLRPDAVCKILNISRKTLCEYNNSHRHRNILKVYRITHKNVQYCEASVYEFREKCRSK